MDSDNFMRWVRDNLVPSFEARYPGKRMVLVLDNAPYHHKRGVESFPTTKSAILAMIRKHGVTHIPLEAKPGVREHAVSAEVTDDFLKTAHKNKPLVPTLDEMKHGFLKALRSSPDAAQRDKLLDEVVTFLQRRPQEHLCLWTPPYCPDMQPIEVFWATGKNYAASSHYNGRKMYETVTALREGWYGSLDGEHKAVSCAGLVKKAQSEMNKRIATDAFLNGSIADLDFSGVPADEWATIEQMQQVDLTLGENGLLDSGNGAGEDGQVLHETSEPDSFQDVPDFPGFDAADGGGAGPLGPPNVLDSMTIDLDDLSAADLDARGYTT